MHAAWSRRLGRDSSNNNQAEGHNRFDYVRRWAFSMRKTYVVTGATSGIGQGIATALAHRQHRVVGVGRRSEALASLEAAYPDAVRGYQLDLTRDEEVDAFASALAADPGRLDGLILSAGVLHTGGASSQSPADLDAMYQSNLRAPVVLVQRLFPLLERARGYVIFVNSSAGLMARPGIVGYAMMQYALRAFADALRQEVNPLGVRVLSIYPGRTATPLVANLFACEGRIYDPELLLQPAQVAEVVTQALDFPPSAELTDVSIRPAVKSY